MPIKTVGYGPKQPTSDSGVDNVNYGPGSTDDHPGLPVVPTIIDESRRHELGGTRDKYGDDFNVSRAELEAARRLLGPWAYARNVR